MHRIQKRAHVSENVKQMVELVDRPYRLLELAAKAAMRGQLKRAWKLIYAARACALEHQAESVHYISAALALAGSREHVLGIYAVQREGAPCSSGSEHATIHRWFRDNYSAAIRGAKLVDVEPERLRPDFNVEVDGVVHPVECKKRFGQSALHQLLAYMQAAGVDHGYAVAASFSIDPYPGITFIQTPTVKALALFYDEPRRSKPPH